MLADLRRQMRPRRHNHQTSIEIMKTLHHLLLDELTPPSVSATRLAKALPGLLLLIGLGLCPQARSEDLTTVDGTTYHNITAQRADPDGLYVEYTPTGGGLGLAKVKFSRLTADQQKQFGYDPGKARDYEAQVAKATEDWRQQTLRSEQVAQAQRAAQQAQQIESERLMNDRIMAMAQLKQAEAQGTSGGVGEGYGWSSGGGYGFFGQPEIGRRVRASTVYAPLVPPAPPIIVPHRPPAR
jgi:hypothetical protein